MKFLTACCTSFLSLFGICSGDGIYTDIFEKQFMIEKYCQLNLSNVNGSIDIVGKDVATITIHAEKIYTQEQDKNDFQIVCSSTIENGITCVTCVSKGSCKRAYQINYTITVPMHCTKINVDNVNGSINISDIQGQHVIDSVNGSISMTNPGDFIKAESVNGAISIVNPSQAIQVKTVNGSVTANITKLIVEDCAVSTINGSITVIGSHNIKGQFSPKTVNGSVKLM